MQLPFHMAIPLCTHPDQHFSHPLGTVLYLCHTLSLTHALSLMHTYIYLPHGTPCPYSCTISDLYHHAPACSLPQPAETTYLLAGLELATGVMEAEKEKKRKKGNKEGKEKGEGSVEGKGRGGKRRRKGKKYH